MSDPFDGVRICGVADHLGQGRMCMWPTPEMPVAITDLPPGVTEAELAEAVTWAGQQIAATCGLNVSLVDRARDARLLITSAFIDGPSGVLADCMLPCGNLQQATLRLDGSESWVTRLGDRRGIVLRLVLLHEMTHGAGLGHAPEGSSNYMAPVYNQNITQAGAWDMAELRRRYGPPRRRQDPTTPTQPGDTMEDRLKEVLNLAAWIAKMTPTPADDKIVAVLSSPLIVKFLASLLDRLGSEPTAQQVADAAKLFAEQVG